MNNENSKNLTELYVEGGYLKGHPNWHAERSPWKAQHILQGLRSANLAPKTLCDIGCGTGLALAEVVRHSGNIDRAVGFEPSPDAPFHPDAKTLIELRREDATRSEDHFDVAMMLDVFEHVEDYFGFLRRCRSLADHFVFHIPLDASAFNVVRSGCMGPRSALGHLHYFTRLTALATLKETGFEPLHWHYTKAAWDGPGSGRNPWKPINIVRRAMYFISPDYTSRIFGGLALLVVAKVA